MRPALRLLASVKPAAPRYLEPGAPTGLTGLHVNPSPRGTLLYLYAATLERLRAAPEASLYRQSVEAVTRQRMALVEAARPAGHDEWLARAAARAPPAGADTATVERAGRTFVLHRPRPVVDERYEEPEEFAAAGRAGPSADKENEAWEPEPQLTVDQIEELENKIGAGLIEEVVQVAEGELKLVDTMIQAKVWESLDEKPREGQWKYFERKE